MCKFMQLIVLNYSFSSKYIYNKVNIFGFIRYIKLRIFCNSKNFFKMNWLLYYLIFFILSNNFNEKKTGLNIKNFIILYTLKISKNYLNFFLFNLIYIYLPLLDTIVWSFSKPNMYSNYSVYLLNFFKLPNLYELDIFLETVNINYAIIGSYKWQIELCLYKTQSSFIHKNALYFLKLPYLC